MRFTIMLAFLALPLLGGCASSGGSGSTAAMREDLGRLLAGPLDDAILEFWTRHRIPLQRREVDSRRIYYESEWMPRNATPPERTRGVVEARNRVRIEGRLIEDNPDPLARVYRVVMYVDNEVLSEAMTGAEWRARPMDDLASQRFEELISDLELELRTGARRE